MRKSLLIAESMVVCALLAGCGNAADESTEFTDRASNEIVGGAAFSGLPAVGALYYDGSMHCTGTLIGPRQVLTAAHCTQGFSASRMEFRIGPSGANPESKVKAAALKPHPQFSMSSITNDVGYVTLAQDAPVAPMKLVDKIDQSWVGRPTLFVGYGVTNGATQVGSGTKRSVTININEVMATQFKYQGQKKSACNGDSGGPAFYIDSKGEHFIVGVTSYGDQYCSQFGVDTRVDTYLSFIGVPGSTPDADTPPTPPPTDPCNGETANGRCDGTTLVACVNEQVTRKDCASTNQQCTLDATSHKASCTTPPPPPPPPPIDDPCQGETYEGRCDGGMLIWCENKKINKQNCTTARRKCGYNQSQGYYDCI